MSEKSEKELCVDFHGCATAEGVPAYLVRDLWQYLRAQVRPGDFMLAVLANDLFSAIQYADPIAAQSLRGIVRFIYLNLPARCWGSREAVNDWLMDSEPRQRLPALISERQKRWL
jgi:hypothetical protein